MGNGTVEAGVPIVEFIVTLTYVASINPECVLS